MKILLPPKPITNPDKLYTVFLAGSIDMGRATHWQDRITTFLRDLDIVVLNPRREHWDSSISNLAHDKTFHDQVEWEQHGLKTANLIVMYFDKASQSPISLLELGLFAESHKMLVYCPEGFWRKGNVDIECEDHNIPHFEDEALFFAAVRERVTDEIKKRESA